LVISVVERAGRGLRKQTECHEGQLESCHDQADRAGSCLRSGRSAEPPRDPLGQYQRTNSQIRPTLAQRNA
jgi:hypothetical protein